MTVLDLLKVVGKKVKHILPNGGLMVIYHCRIRKKVTLNKSKTKATLMLQGPVLQVVLGCGFFTGTKKPCLTGYDWSTGVEFSRGSIPFNRNLTKKMPRCGREDLPTKPFTLENMWSFFHLSCT